MTNTSKDGGEVKRDTERVDGVSDVRSDSVYVKKEEIDRIRKGVEGVCAGGGRKGRWVKTSYKVTTERKHQQNNISCRIPRRPSGVSAYK